MIFCRPILRNLAAAVAVATLGLSPAAAQCPAPVPVPPDPLPVGTNQAPPDSFAAPSLFGPSAPFSNDYHWVHHSAA